VHQLSRVLLGAAAVALQRGAGTELKCGQRDVTGLFLGVVESSQNFICILKALASQAGTEIAVHDKMRGEKCDGGSPGACHGTAGFPAEGACGEGRRSPWATASQRPPWEEGSVWCLRFRKAAETKAIIMQK